MRLETPIVRAPAVRATAPNTADLPSLVADRTYRSSFQLGPDDARRAVRLVAQLLGASPPVVMVNRGVTGARDLLERGGRIRTVHDVPADAMSPALKEYAARRAEVEARLGLGGTAGLEHQTVYGSLQWPGAARDRWSGRFVRNLGLVDGYGGAALVLDRSVLDRATFTSDDSLVAIEPGQVGTRRDLPSVILDSIEPGALAKLIHLDDRGFQRGVLEHTRTYPGSTYIEVQVPAPTVDEIRQVRIPPDITGESTKNEFRGGTVSNDVIASLRAAGTRRGIPILD